MITKLSEILTGYSYYLNMMVSVRRIDLFLGAEDKETEEREDFSVNIGSNSAQFALKIANGDFVWRFDQVWSTGQSDTALSQERVELRLLQTSKNKKSTFRDEMQEGFIEDQLVIEDQESEPHQTEKKCTKTTGFMLRNINLSIKKGEKIGVIGRSSSGTSSLLYAMIGEMIPINSAKVCKHGSISYLSQSRWLMGASIKENILLGKPYNHDLMQMALGAADLLKDLDQFSNGIETVLSDNGDSVSGGQRARIALARCFYQE